MRGTIIALSNQKGGVGKTTTCANLGIGLAMEGKKVLVVDGDPQSSLSISLGYPQPDQLPVTITDLMKKVILDKPITEGEGILHQKEGVDLLPASIELAGLEASMVNVMSRETILRQVLNEIGKPYDFILLDCMPSLGMLTINALAAADSVLIPVQAHYLPAKGLEQLLQTISKVRRQINPDLRIEGVLLTMVDSRTNYARDISNLIRETYGGKLKVFATDIPLSVRAAEISAEGKSIYAHDPKGKVAAAYKELTKEVLHDDVSGKNISLTSYDDIFSTDETRTDSEREKIVEIPLSELHPFKNHPFRVMDDDQMREMADSVRTHGVFIPAIARRLSDGSLELISGHRRKRACELAGLKSMPVIIRNLDDDEATIAMVESNLRQRENIMISERAKAMLMMMEAVKHQGQRQDLTSSKNETKLQRADEIVAEQTGISRSKVQRIIRLNNLIPRIMDLVDEKKIAEGPAYELSYLKAEEQEQLLDAMGKYQSSPSVSQAQRMKKLSQEGRLSFDSISSILSEIKKPQNMPKESAEVMNPSPITPVQAIKQEERSPLFADGFIMLPIEPFLKFLPKSLFQNPTPESQEKMTKLFLRMAELYTRKKEQQR